LSYQGSIYISLLNQYNIYILFKEGIGCKKQCFGTRKEMGYGAIFVLQGVLCQKKSSVYAK